MTQLPFQEVAPVQFVGQYQYSAENQVPDMLHTGRLAVGKDYIARLITGAESPEEYAADYRVRIAKLAIPREFQGVVRASLIETMLFRDGVYPSAPLAKIIALPKANESVPKAMTRNITLDGRILTPGQGRDPLPFEQDGYFLLDPNNNGPQFKATIPSSQVHK